MTEKTTIEWASHTFNPWIGCSHIHTGCANCYAEAQAGRYGVTWGPEGARHRTSEAYWRKPIAWNRRAAQSGERPRVFCSLCDPFDEWDGKVVRPWDSPLLGRRKMPIMLDDLRGDLFRLIDRTQNLDWVLLTKRPENVRRMWARLYDPDEDELAPRSPRSLSGHYAYRPNVWLGASISEQDTADELIPELLKLRDLARCVFVSLEPLLGAVDLREWIFPACDGIDESCESGHCDHSRPLVDWVIVGGESGPKARPCKVEWMRSIVEQCKVAALPCFVKQLGANTDRFIGERTVAAGFAGPRLVKIRPSHPKGGDPTEWPDDLRIRELPEA